MLPREDRRRRGALSGRSAMKRPASSLLIVGVRDRNTAVFPKPTIDPGRKGVLNAQEIRTPPVV
jgi:hypothetical protein